MMVYEWLIEIPQSLGPAWRVIARPEGKRCLVIASRGRTVARQKSGTVLATFPSALPNGSKKTRRARTSFCMLDAVYHEPDATFYVIDALAWNGVHLAGTSMDCRTMWVQANLEHSPAAGQPGPGHTHRIRPCPVHVCTEEGLRAAYAGAVPYERDGLLFMHRDTPYVMEANPYTLQWKDEHCSRWAVDTGGDGSRLEAQEVVLAFQQDGSVATGDAPSPVTLGRMPAAVLQQYGHKMKAGLLLRFRVGPGGFYLGEDGMPVGADLQWVGVANQRRAAADLYSRIVFKWQARSQGSKFEAILDVVRGNAGVDTAAQLPIFDAIDAQADAEMT